MGVTLVVGATGQLGTAVVRRARAAGREVRALIRPSSDHAHLRSRGVELCYGDLRDRDSLSAACSGATEVIATATVVFPRGGYSFERDEGVGYRDLLRACREQGVAQFLFTSTLRFPEPYVSRVPTLRLKRTVEQLAREGRICSSSETLADFGFDTVHLCGDDSTPDELALRAARLALAEAKLDPEQIDVLVWASARPECHLRRNETGAGGAERGRQRMEAERRGDGESQRDHAALALA